MNDTLIQAVMWLGAGGTLLMYLRRRRAKKSQR